MLTLRISASDPQRTSSVATDLLKLMVSGLSVVIMPRIGAAADAAIGPYLFIHRQRMPVSVAPFRNAMQLALYGTRSVSGHGAGGVSTAVTVKRGAASVGTLR